MVLRQSLRTKILALVVGTATGLAAMILLSLSWYADREITRSVRNDVRETGNVLTQFVEAHNAALKDQCSLLAKQSVLKAVLSTNDPATVTDEAYRLKNQCGADLVLITDQDGRVLGVTDPKIAPHTDLSREPGIAAALSNKPSWAGVVLRQNRLMLAVSIPVVSFGYVQGTFTAYRAVDSQIAVQMRSVLGTDVAFLSHGHVVASSLPLPSSIVVSQGTPQVITLNGTRYFALYAPLPNTQAQDAMGFVTLHRYDQAMGFYQRLREGLIGVTAITLLVALLAGTFLARNLTRPLDGVVQAAHVLERGEWPERFTVKRRDEIGLLQSVFNEMTSSMRENQERMLALIDTDALTGLDNHRRFHERLGQEAKRSTHSGEALSLLLFDLDHFQQFNQRQGHSAGDSALTSVAQRLRECLPEVAILSRYGGEEFAALLPQHTLGQAEELAEQVRVAVAETFSNYGGAIRLTVSVGCAEFGTHSSEAEGLLLAAELAESRAKQLGRNRVCRFDSVPGVDQNADPYQLHRFLKDESLATIQALAAAVDAKDPYTQGHSLRVAEYASALARFLGKSEKEVESIYTTGTLHDVGKIGVPDVVLKKPSRLDDDERAIIETHPALGEVIVKKAPALAFTLAGVRHHHERWDGRGYPDRLAGEDIPYVGRLLALADTFDAMTSDRPYRKGLAWEIALGEIERSAGTQFDPILAKAFVTLMRQPQQMAEAA
jgi:diguanylate cyclase (GGDEF)-like protein